MRPPAPPPAHDPHFVDEQARLWRTGNGPTRGLFSTLGEERRPLDARSLYRHFDAKMAPVFSKLGLAPTPHRILGGVLTRLVSNARVVDGMKIVVLNPNAIPDERIYAAVRAV